MGRMNAKVLVYEADLHRKLKDIPNLVDTLPYWPGLIEIQIDRFLSEFDYENNKNSERAKAIRELADMVVLMKHSMEKRVVRRKKIMGQVKSRGLYTYALCADCDEPVEFFKGRNFILFTECKCGLGYRGLGKNLIITQRAWNHMMNKHKKEEGTNNKPITQEKKQKVA